MESSRHAYAILGLLTLLALGSAANSSMHTKGFSNTQPVLVVNPGTSPIPTSAQGTTQVAGTVGVSSLPAVQISSLPAVQVQSDPNNPLAVQDATEAKRTWMTFKGDVVFSSQSSDAAVNLYTVPAGKQFVMEYTNAQFTIGGGPKPARIGVADVPQGVGPTGPGYDMPTQVVGPDETGAINGVAEAHGPIIFQPGDTLVGLAVLSGSGGGGFTVFTVTGFLQDAPPAS
jgi:hypothetical protein